MVAQLFHGPDIYFLLTGTFIFDFYFMPKSFHTSFIAKYHMFLSISDKGLYIYSCDVPRLSKAANDAMQNVHVNECKMINGDINHTHDITEMKNIIKH